MNRVIILCGLVSLAAAAAIPEKVQAKILTYENSNDGAGNYKFRYTTSDGITREEVGHLVNIGKEDEHMEVKGFYSYTDPEGSLVVVTYTVDQNGYHLGPSQVSASLPASVTATLLG